MNIKKKNFHEDDNKTQMNHIKNKSGITSNIIELKLNNQIHNHKNSDFSFNKVSEKNLKKNQSYQNNLYLTPIGTCVSICALGTYKFSLNYTI